MSTSAPSDLLAVRAFLEPHTGEPADELGIVGDTAHGDSGYHIGDPPAADYSVRESPRDHHPDGYASAIDIGGDFPRFREITLALVHHADQGDPRLRDVREIIYTPDGSTVRRWDRLGIRSTGDSSHLRHTHFSFFRDSRGARGDVDNFLGLLQELFDAAPGTLPVSTPTGDTVTTRLPTLRQGAGMPPATSDLHVSNVQALANVRGAGLVVDGQFGPKTDSAVRYLQVHNHIANSVTAAGVGDGVVGENTWAFLLAV